MPKVRIGHNVSNAKINSDGTFTDDYTRTFEDMVVTPRRTELKRGSYSANNWNYAKAHRKDWMKTQWPSAVVDDKPLEEVYPEFDLISLSPLLKPLAKKGLTYTADKAGFFVQKPNSFTRGIGGEAGLNDLFESGLVRGNPAGSEMTAANFAKHFRRNRNNYRDIMDATKIEGIAQRHFNRTLTKEDFNAIKEAAKPYVQQFESMPEEIPGKFGLKFRDPNPDPLDGYVDYADYLNTIQKDRQTLKHVTSWSEDGQPLAYFYNDGRNPILAGHDYAASKYGVRINNASDYNPKIFLGHLHYSMPRTVSLYDPNVELFKRGPFGITIRMRKPKPPSP